MPPFPVGTDVVPERGVVHFFDIACAAEGEDATDDDVEVADEHASQFPAILSSGHNPPRSDRRILGDLAYLEVVVPNEGTFCVTATPAGFYVNRSQYPTAANHRAASNGSAGAKGRNGGAGTGGGGVRFDARPTKGDNCFSHCLLGCILKRSAGIRNAWAKTLADSRARALASLSSDETPLRALLKVVRSGAVDSVVLRPSWLLPPHPAPPSAGRDPPPDLNRHDDDPSVHNGMDLRGPPRDWNEELQSARDMPLATAAERALRARLVHRVLTEFGEAAVGAVHAIVSGTVQPMNPTEPPRSHVYIYNGIFFSRAVDAVDTYKVATGDRAARKAASRDCGVVQLLHRMDHPGLHSLATCVIDHLGSRVVAQSIIPGILHGDHRRKLTYGAVEPGSRVVRTEEVHAMMEKIFGTELYVASRAVPVVPILRRDGAPPLEGAEEAAPADESDAKTVVICGPLEAKGIIGVDDRNYVLDVTRVTPRDANWIPATAGGTGCWEKFEGERKTTPRPHVPESLQDDEWTMAVLRPELVSSYVNEDMAQWVDQRKKTRAEARTALGEAPTPAETEALEKTFHAENEAHLRDLALNVNVFLDLPYVQTVEGIDDAAFAILKDDEARVKKISAHLFDDIVPTLTKDIRNSSGNLVPIDGTSLTQMLHSRGINCRYLGRLAILAQAEEEKDREAERAMNKAEPGDLPRRSLPLAWLEALEREMVARASNHVLDSYLSANNGSVALQPGITVAAFLSAITSTGEESAAETDARLNAGVGEHFDLDDLTVVGAGGGGTGVPGMTRSRAEMWRDLEAEVGRRFRYRLTLYGGAAPPTARAPALPLLRRVSQRNGLRLVAKDYAFARGGCRYAGGVFPVSPADIVDVVPRMKHGAAATEGFLPCPPAGAPFSSTSLHVLLPDAKELLEAASLHWSSNRLERALALAQEASAAYQQVIGGILHSSVARCMDLISVILFQAQEHELAADNAARSLSIAVQLGGFDCHEAVAAHSTLSHLLISSGDLGAGIRHMRCSLYLTELMAGPSYPELSNIYHKMGSIYHEVGQVLEALRFYQEALSRKPCDRMMESMIAKSTGLVLASMGQFKAALEIEKRAFHIYRFMLGEEHDLTKNSANSLKHFMKLAVEQGTRSAIEEKKRKEEAKADSNAQEIINDMVAEEDAKKKKKKKKSNRKKK